MKKPIAGWRIGLWLLMTAFVALVLASYLGGGGLIAFSVLAAAVWGKVWWNKTHGQRHWWS